MAAENAGYILRTLGCPERTMELVKIAGHLHDIGNLVNRAEHSQSGAVMTFRVLDNLDCDPEKITTIVTAIGNHDEGIGQPVNAVAAALILASQKADAASVQYHGLSPFLCVQQQYGTIRTAHI